jgi:hypothetical protein
MVAAGQCRQVAYHADLPYQSDSVRPTSSAAGPPASSQPSPPPALAGNWRQHFLLSGRRLARLLAGPLGSFRLGRRAADASAQRFHKIHNVLATGPLLRGDRFAGALLIDEINQRRFVLIFKLLGLEPSGFLERNDVFALVTTRPMATLVHLADGLADHREGVVPDLAVGS